MHTNENLYNPHVTIVHGHDGKHHYSFLMIVPKGSSVMYRNIRDSAEPNPGDGSSSSYELEFSFDSNPGSGWFGIPNLDREAITFNGKPFDVVTFTRIIKDIKNAKVVTRVTGHPHHKDGIVVHDDTVHLPGNT